MGIGGRTLALLLLIVLAAAPAWAQGVAVLGARPPWVSDTDIARVRRALAAAHVVTSLLMPEEAADPEKLAPGKVDLLLVPGADAFPAIAQANLLAYLRARGRLLVLGEASFSRPCYRVGALWKTWEEMASELPAAATIVDTATTDPAAWTRSTNDPKSPATLVRDGGTLRMECARFTNWDNFAAPPFLKSPYPAGAELLAFRARGDAQTTALVLEWREADGSRWLTSVPLTTNWKRYVVAPSDFRFWPDSAAPGRGRPGDAFRPQNARGFSFGLANSHAPLSAGPKRLWIADLTAVRAPENAPRVEPPVLEGLSPTHKRIVPFGNATAALPAGTSRKGHGWWFFRPEEGEFAGARWGKAAHHGPLVDAVRQILEPCRLIHAGPKKWVWRPDEPIEFTGVLANDGDRTRSLRCLVEIQAPGRRVRTGHALVCPPGRTPFQLRLPPLQGSGDRSFRVWLAPGGDALAGRLSVAPDSATPRSPRVRGVTIREGGFVRGGKPWRPVGVNFWPLWVSGQEPAAFRDETWLSPRQYDPLRIEADLTLAQALGIDLVSIQYTRLDQADAVRDFLIRCQRHGILANIYIEGGHPLTPDHDKLVRLLHAARLADSDALFAYDVAWEPHVGPESARRRFDDAWAAWVTTHYGAVEKAERDWQIAAPRRDGRLTTPPDAWFTTDGPHRILVAAYRRFVETLIRDGYQKTRAAIRSVDPVHLIGARTGYGGNGTLEVEGVLAFDLRAGARHLDFLSPEGYALSGSREDFVNGGGFVTAYARWASGGKPVFWAEFGRSVHPQPDASNLAAQAQVIGNTWAMITASGASGGAAWWWPGGLRVDENSDYGLIEPDGTPRPAARLLGMQGTLVSSGPHRDWRVDRDADARGFAALWERGRRTWTPGMRIVTAGTGTTTATVPLVAVGNVPADGQNPLQYVDAEAQRCRADRRSGSFTLQVVFGNDGEAAWQANGPGAVVLNLFVDGHFVRTEPLLAPTPRLAAAAWTVRDLDGFPGQRVTARLAVVGRTPQPLAFGDVATATIQ